MHHKDFVGAVPRSKGETLEAELNHVYWSPTNYQYSPEGENQNPENTALITGSITLSSIFALFCCRATPSGALGFLLALCSGVIPDHAAVPYRAPGIQAGLTLFKTDALLTILSL